MEEIEQRVAAIARDAAHGATFLTEEAVWVLGAAAVSWAEDTCWAEHLADVARRLAEAKPAMAGLRNACHRLLNRLLELGPGEGRTEARKQSGALVACLRDAATHAAEHAARLLPDNGAVATCSYGSAVLRACGKARERGKVLTVLVIEPCPGPEAYGNRLAKELADGGTPAAVVDERGVDDAMARVRLALVGADAVTRAHVVNGAPTLALARAADGRVPLYVVCETIKFTPDVPATPGYDRVPLALVSGIATEDGLLTGEEAGRRAYGGLSATCRE